MHGSRPHRSQRPHGRCSRALRLSFLGLLPAVLFAACSGDRSDPPAPPPPTTTLQVNVDASMTTGLLRQLWGDHYDLSYTALDYGQEPGFPELVDSLEPRSIRISVGRWEVGLPPPAGGDSSDPMILAGIEREFYRGANTLSAADDPANYDFTYLDRQLADWAAQGAEPFLSFDYMPFTLAAEQNPNNLDNFNLTEPGIPFARLSFSNGIRTAPPATPAVYARVVRNTMKHTMGMFAGTMDYGVRDFEVGNEPDVVLQDGSKPNPFFTGSRTDWAAMYLAIASDVDADVTLNDVRFGGGSFAFLPWEPQPLFCTDVLSSIAAASARLDFLSFHCYSDASDGHLACFLRMSSVVASTGTTARWVNGEWGRALGEADPVYDEIEHGLLRAKVIGLMQLFPFDVAHESILRDPGAQPDLLGLLRTGPPRHKPVSDVYRAFNLLNETLDAVSTDAPDGVVVLAGRDTAGTRVAALVVVDPPKAGERTRVRMQWDNLPWAGGACQVQRYRVTQASSDLGLGVELLETLATVGPTVTSDSLVIDTEAGVYVWVLTAQ